MTKKKRLVRKKPRGKKGCVVARRAVKGRKSTQKRVTKKRMGSRSRKTAVHQKPKSRPSRQLLGSEVRGFRTTSEKRPRGIAEGPGREAIFLGDRDLLAEEDETRPESEENDETWPEDMGLPDDDVAIRSSRAHPGDKDGSN